MIAHYDDAGQDVEHGRRRATGHRLGPADSICCEIPVRIEFLT